MHYTDFPLPVDLADILREGIPWRLFPSLRVKGTASLANIAKRCRTTPTAKNSACALFKCDRKLLEVTSSKQRTKHLDRISRDFNLLRGEGLQRLQAFGA